MADDSAMQKFIAERDRLLREHEEKRVKTPMETSPAGQAFVGQDQDMANKAALPDLSKPAAGGDIVGNLTDIAAGLYGENKAAQVVDALPIPEQYKLPADMVARMVGTAATVAPAHFSYQQLRKAVGDPKTPDSMWQSVEDSWNAAKSQATAVPFGVAGSGLQDAAARSLWAADPKRLDDLHKMRDTLIKVYEDTGGAPLAQDMRGRWNPMRRISSLPDDLDNTTVAQNLRSKGLDPEMARRVALTGGYTTADLLDNAPYSFAQKVAETAPVGSKYINKYQTTRAKMLQMAATDLGNEFGTQLPVEMLGKSVANAIDGRFNVPNMVMTNGLKAVNDNLETGMGFDLTPMKRAANGANLSKDGVARMLGELPSLPNGTTNFENIKNLRMQLNSIAHSDDPAITQQAKDEASTLSNLVDRHMLKQLPEGARKGYVDATSADNVMKSRGFDSDFVKGMLNSRDGGRAYGEWLLRQGDVENFNKMERAIGTDEANKVRRGISDQVTAGLVNADGSVSPANVDKILNEHGDYGRYFLKGVLGDKWTQGAERLKSTLTNLDEASHNNKWVNYGTNALRYAPLSKVLWDAYQGQISYKDVAIAAASFTTPRVLGKMLTNPEALKGIEKASQLAKTGSNPRMFSRLVSRSLAAMGELPDNLLQENNYDPEGYKKNPFDIDTNAMPAMML